jgi:hypothetical protein
MPVRKYRSVEDMPAAAFRPPLDPMSLRLACELSATAVRLAPRRVSPGVRRYHSIAEAFEHRQEWERSRPS